MFLARAIYKQPSVLILDEATSHLDGACEQKFIHALKLMDVTRIIIAHRLETIKSADKAMLCMGGQVRPIELKATSGKSREEVQTEQINNYGARYHSLEIQGKQVGNPEEGDDYACCNS